MFRHLSTPNLLITIIFCIAFQTRADLVVSSMRQSGAPLDPSIQNETDHAVQQAALWLAAHQRSDGSWGAAAPSIRLTSLALLALSAANQPEHSDARVRATLWLDLHATNRCDGLGAHAWRLIALTRLLPDSPARRLAVTRCDALAQPFVETAAPSDLRLWHEARVAAGLSQQVPAAVATEADKAFARLSALWLPALLSNAEAWDFSHLINAHPGGQLLRDNTPLDWRRDLAQRLVNAQRNDPAGGGYWEAPTADEAIAETAFGLLALREL